VPPSASGNDNLPEGIAETRDLAKRYHTMYAVAINFDGGAWALCYTHSLASLRSLQVQI
jgi:hypothetical protein